MFSRVVKNFYKPVRGNKLKRFSTKFDPNYHCNDVKCISKQNCKKMEQCRHSIGTTECENNVSSSSTNLNINFNDDHANNDININFDFRQKKELANIQNDCFSEEPISNNEFENSSAFDNLNDVVNSTAEIVSEVAGSVVEVTGDAVEAVGEVVKAIGDAID